MAVRAIVQPKRIAQFVRMEAKAPTIILHILPLYPPHACRRMTVMLLSFRDPKNDDDSEVRNGQLIHFCVFLRSSSDRPGRAGQSRQLIVREWLHRHIWSAL